MKNYKFAIVMLLAIFMVVSSIEIVEAQRKPRARAAVKRDVKVTRRVHHKVVVRKAHVRYVHLPRWRTVVTTVPAAAVVIKTRKDPYYFHDGIFYAPAASRFVIVRPVPGVRIKVLPAAHRKIIVGPRPYFYYYGTFYTKADNSDEYETVDPPEGAIVDALPDGYEIKTKNGVEYYVLDEVYYAEVDAPEYEDGVGFEVVKL